jgi:CubicO group peptidase (beta-lactamase class C family)
MSARDLARFKLLYLDGGNWRDRQIVPAQWVKDSTRAYSQSDFGPIPDAGYGYLWWTGFGRLPPGTFFAAGAGGQFAFVIPAADLVFIFANSGPSVDKIGRLLSLVLDASGARHP